MAFTADIVPYVWPTLMAAIGGYTIWHYGGLLALVSGSDMRFVWYLYSLGLTATVLVVWMAFSLGAIDSRGGFHGSFGEVLEWLMYAMIDLVGELKFIGAIAALILVPQALSYLISGLWGCAGPLVLVNWTIQFAFWSLVKFLAVGAGVVTVVVLAVWGLGWTTIMSGTTAYSFLGLALLAVGAALAATATYRLPGGLIFGKTPPKRNWATRKLQPATPAEVAAPPGGLSDLESTELVTITLSVKLNGEVTIVNLTPLPKL